MNHKLIFPSGDGDNTQISINYSRSSPRFVLNYERHDPASGWETIGIGLSINAQSLDEMIEALQKLKKFYNLI